MAFASLVLISSVFIPYIAEAIIYFPEMNGYIDPLTKKYTVVGHVMNYHPTQKPIGDLTIGIQFLGEDQSILAESQVRVSKLLRSGQMNIPYFMPIPFKVELDDIALSQKVKFATFNGMEVREATEYKHADLLLVSKEIYLIDSNEYGKKWTVFGKIKNDHIKPAENVHVIATLYNSTGYIIGVAGLDSMDKQPSRIGAMETEDFLISTWLPKQQVPTKAVVHAESDNSTLQTPYSFPLIANHSLTGIGSETIRPIGFHSNVTSISRDDLEFYWILQIKKLLDDELCCLFEEATVEHIATIQSSVKTGMSTMIDYEWKPEKEGFYFDEIYLWSDLDNPVPLSFPRRHGHIYAETMFRVSK